MSSRPPNIEASLRAFGDYLRDKLPGVEVIHEFPEPSQQLRYPSISLSGSSARQFNIDLAGATSTKAEYETQEADAQTGIIPKVPVRYGVGNYDFPFQMDLWTSSKADREALYEKLFEVLNPEIYPMGLTLTLDEYYGETCNYIATGFSPMFNAEQAQKGEWRMMIPFAAQCRAIRGRPEHIVKEFEVDTELPDNIS